MANNDGFKIDDTILKNRKMNTPQTGGKNETVPEIDRDSDAGDAIHIEIGEMDYDPESGQWKDKGGPDFGWKTDSSRTEIKEADYRVCEDKAEERKALPDKNSGKKRRKKSSKKAPAKSRKKGSGDKKTKDKKPMPLHLQILYGTVVLACLAISFIWPYRYLSRLMPVSSDAAVTESVSQVRRGTWCTIKSNSLDGVPVYAEPGDTAQIAFVPEGKYLQLLDEVLVGQKEWGKIDYCGITAWIPMKRINFITEEEAFIKKGSLVYMNALSEKGISAYSEPSQEAEPVAEGLIYGTELTVESLENGWAKVNYEGKECWVNMYHMGSYGTDLWRVETLTRGRQVNLRQEAGRESKVLCKIPEMERLTILEFKNGWGAVEYGEYHGWVMLHYLTPVSEEEEPSVSDDQMVLFLSISGERFPKEM